MFTYTGEMGADFWALGAWWADQVAAKWEKAVEASVTSIRAEAERQAVTRKPARPRRGPDQCINLQHDGRLECP